MRSAAIASTDSRLAALRQIILDINFSFALMQLIVLLVLDDDLCARLGGRVTFFICGIHFAEIVLFNCIAVLLVVDHFDELPGWKHCENSSNHDIGDYNPSDSVVELKLSIILAGVVKEKVKQPNQQGQEIHHV